MKKKRNRHLKGKGEMSYDFEHDILFFKTKEREYDRSIEINNMVLDIDKKKFIVGIQIFEASKFLRLNRAYLVSIPAWKFEATIKDNLIEVRLVFNVLIRNKIIEKNPIITDKLMTPLPYSMVECKH